MSAGPLFLFSLFFLGMVVCVVYTLAMEVEATGQQIITSAAHRLLRLFGVLVALAVVVYFFGLI